MAGKLVHDDQQCTAAHMLAMTAYDFTNDAATLGELEDAARTWWEAGDDA